MLQFEANFRLNSHSPSQEEPLNASALLNIVGLHLYGDLVWH